MPPAKKLTQAQKEILALYRKGLRMIKTKEQVRVSYLDHLRSDETSLILIKLDNFICCSNLPSIAPNRNIEEILPSICATSSSIHHGAAVSAEETLRRSNTCSGRQPDYSKQPLSPNQSSTLICPRTLRRTCKSSVSPTGGARFAMHPLPLLAHPTPLHHQYPPAPPTEVVSHPRSCPFTRSE